VQLHPPAAPLNIATLRLTGDDAVLDDAIRKLNLKVDWRAKVGEPRRRGGVHETASLNSPIAEATNPAGLMIQVRSFLAKCLDHPNMSRIAFSVTAYPTSYGVDQSSP
jgi:hypothetical protein